MLVVVVFNTRHAIISSDVDVGSVRSRFTRELIGLYDTYLLNDDPLDFVLVDPYQRFFVVASDLAILFESQIDSDRYVVLPYIRMIFVVRHRRGTGIQSGLLEELKSVSDSVAESFAIVASPFVLCGTGRETNAYEAIGKLTEFGETETENYTSDLVRQTRRFKAAGLTNIKFSNASVTEPFQHYVYVATTEPPERAEILMENAVEYVIDEEKLASLE